MASTSLSLVSFMYWLICLWSDLKLWHATVKLDFGRQDCVHCNDDSFRILSISCWTRWSTVIFIGSHSNILSPFKILTLLIATYTMCFWILPLNDTSRVEPWDLRIDMASAAWSGNCFLTIFTLLCLDVWNFFWMFLYWSPRFVNCRTVCIHVQVLIFLSCDWSYFIWLNSTQTTVCTVLKQCNICILQLAPLVNPSAVLILCVNM